MGHNTPLERRTPYAEWSRHTSTETTRTQLERQADSNCEPPPQSLEQSAESLAPHRQGPAPDPFSHAQPSDAPSAASLPQNFAPCATSPYQPRP
eukprot:1224991-Pyramimonas_sp.AAC.1